MVKLANRVKVITATIGTGTITLSAAVGGYQTFADGGVADGDIVRYTIEDGINWEIGSGIFDLTAGTVTRTVSESSTGSMLSLSGDAVVYVTASGEDIVQPSDLATVATTGAYSDLSGLPSEASQLLLNRPLESNFSLDNGIYYVNFTGGTVTGNVAKDSTGLSATATNLIPVMSGGTATSCSSGSVSCSVTPAASGDLSRLFDGGVTYFRQYTSSTMTVTVDLGATTDIEDYIIDSFANITTYQPRAWTFQGSPDNSTWTTLDTYNNTSVWGVPVLVRPVVASYRYFRWAFTLNNGSPTTGYVIDEMNIRAVGAATGSFVSEALTASSAPTKVALKAHIQTPTAPVSGTTYTVYASRDNGTTWTAVPFSVTPENIVPDGFFYISGEADISSQPTGTQLKYKMEFSSADFTSIDVVTFNWS